MTPRTGTPVVSRRAVLAALAAASLPLGACGRRVDGPPLLVAEGVGRVRPGPGAPVAQAVDGLADLGYRLCVESAAAGQNWVASPLSIAVAFAMARVGAGGTTASQLDATFGFPVEGRDEAFNAITQRLVTTDVPPVPNRKPRDARQRSAPPVVSIGNALFPQTGFPIGEPFLRTLAAQYGAGARPVDFGKADAVRQINAWAERQTAGRVKGIFHQLDPTTRLVLANAVYFKADWQAPFVDQSRAAGFTRADGSLVQAPMMHAQRTIRYARVDGGSAIELPYAGGPYAMWLMLPRPGGKPEDLVAPAALAAMRGAWHDARVDVVLPKWDFSTTLDLVAILSRLGLVAPFDAAADFRGIAAGLVISEAVHAADISVDEWGTEAAAVTGIAMELSAPPQPDVEFHADRPFAFAIVGGSDGIPLFIGRVSDPTG